MPAHIVPMLTQRTSNGQLRIDAAYAVTFLSSQVSLRTVVTAVRLGSTRASPWTGAGAAAGQPATRGPLSHGQLRIERDHVRAARVEVGREPGQHPPASSCPSGCLS